MGLDLHTADGLYVAQGLQQGRHEQSDDRSNECSSCLDSEIA